ncbi:cilia- and flagella-associated protein 53 [Siniperca chuatsi]|uniref:cilia- and flagella-associated protein 53 n=1 Tax=Siniperca chuatsi TaxID=119488 RepID=UPI001CE22764|nr:cilia- and flagella-associated protein 53 [Siniperca chuatsi]
MSLSPRRRRCREFTGPTPHSVAVRAKFPSSRPADQLILERQKQDAARDKVLEFTKNQQSCDIKSSWLRSSDGRFLRGTIERRVRAALSQQEVHIQERRDRLRVLLEAEEQQLLQEMEEKVETSVERQAKMRERAKALRERRETDRQQLVSDKLEQLFREQCEELRTVQSRRREQQVCEERAAQVRSRQRRRRRQQEEEELFDELWEADRRAKEEREAQRAQTQQRRNLQQLDSIRSQMEAAEQQRRKHRQLREEEARLMLQQQQMQRLQRQREQQQKLRDQQTRRRQLDQGFRLKMKRLSREQQDELQLDMNILQALLKQETDEKQEAAQRKAELRQEQQVYRQYLSDELHKQKREEEETEQLIEEKLKEVWAKREEQSRLQREARNRLMQEVMEARSLQIQLKLDLNLQKQVELSKERDELNRVMEEMKLMDEEEKRRQKQTCEAYRADLKAQMKQQQQLRCEERAQAEREHQQGLVLQERFNHKKEEILSRPASHTTAPHPFRRAEGSSSASRHRLT